MSATFCSAASSTGQPEEHPAVEIGEKREVFLAAR
jgi:hypothetical protein